MSTLMAMLKRPLSLKAAVGYRNIVWGISLLLLAVSYSISNKIVDVVLSFGLLIMIIAVIVAIVHKKEEEDEMYVRHIGKASDLALTLLVLLLAIFAIIGDEIHEYVSVGQILYVCAGIAMIVKGIMFNKFEKNGD